MSPYSDGKSSYRSGLFQKSIFKLHNHRQIGRLHSVNKKPNQKKNKRLSFAKTKVKTPLPNLIETQGLSYSAFLQRDVPPNERKDQGLQSVFKEVFPIRDFSETNSLEFVGYSLGTPKYTLQECVARGVTYQVSLTARIMLVLREADPDADEPHVVDIRESDVYLGEVPLMTENGSFIVNGSERVIVSQLHRSPGAIFLEKSLPTGRRTPTAQIIPYRGAWVEFEVDAKDQIYVRIDKRKKLPATVLLRALGWESDADILKLYAKTERLVLDGWRVTSVEAPATQVKSDDLLTAAEFRQAKKDYPDIEVEKVYRVISITPEEAAAEAFPLTVGQEITYTERTRFRRKWKGFETELLQRVVDTHNSGCEFTVGEILTNSEYEDARDRYGKDTFTAEPERAAPENSKGRVCAEDVIHQETGEVLLTANTLLTETELERLQESAVEALIVLDEKDCQHIRFLRNTLERDRQADYPDQSGLRDAALLDIFRTLRPGDPASVENARKHLSWLLFDPHRYDLGVVGRYKLNHKFKNTPVYGEPPEETFRTLRAEDIAATVAHLLNVHNGVAPKDDLDHLGNRRVRVIGELLENQFRMGLFQIRRTTRERLSTTSDIDKIVPSTLINPKPLMMALREFFGSNQLSQFMQQINPLDELTHKRRISAIGPGGLHRDRATAAVRDVHRTHYGRVCPLETPEGPSIGLIVSLACYGRINPYGFIETPYYPVEDGSRADTEEYLTADSEDAAFIAAKAIPRDTKGDANASEQTLPVRSGEDVLSLPMERVDYIGVAPQQIVGVSAALVPFLEHEDANRALMGSNHQRQAVPLIKPEAPLVGTGMEEPAARYSGALITATRAGTVTSVSADEILIYTGETLHHDKGENTFSEMGYDVYKLQTFKRSNSGTCIHQRPIVAVGDDVEVGKVIADGTSTENGELALGRNVLCAYMPWGGHNYEDSILISEGLIKGDTFTSIHIEEFEVEARETKVGPEEITRDIPNVSEARLTQLDEEGIIRVGSVVGTGSILVGKITPKGESEYGPEEKLLRAIFGEKVKEVRDASTYVRPGVEGVVIDVKVFSRKPDVSQRRGDWTPGESGASIPDGLRFESKRKEIEETWHEQCVSIRYRKGEEIRKTLIGCELANPLYTVGGNDAPVSFADMGDTLTAEILDTYISGFTADEYYTVTEDTVSEAFVAETLYRVTDVPELAPTVVVHYPDLLPEDPMIAEGDENDGMIEEIADSPHFGPETVEAVQAYLGRICEPLLENTEPLFDEATEPLATQSDAVDVVLRAPDDGVVAVAVCEDAHLEGEDPSEQFKDAIAETGARFGVLVTEENSEPDSWGFYELVTANREPQTANRELREVERSEFEQAVVAQLEASGGPLTEGQMLTQSEWEQFSQTYLDLQTELFWHVTEVFEDECPLTVGQNISDADHQQVSRDFPARSIAAGQRLTPEERASLVRTAKDLKTEGTWHITAVFDPQCELQVGDDVSDADYQKARKACSLSLSDIRVTDAEAMEHIQRVEEMAQGRITAYTEEKEQALQQLEMGDELKPGVIKRVKVYVASKRSISVGDKMAGRYGNKGVVAKILPEEDMPYLPDGTPVELVLNPLGVPSRMNVGQILEIHLGWACHELGIYAESPVFDGATEAEIFEMLGKTDLPERSKQTGKSILYDGRSGEPFAQEVTVGHVYFLKLNHLVADKMHARSTGPYSLVTQQPLGGKAQHGGQRLGEMEVWALEAYGAAHTLQEMLTIKSDDVLGRREIYESVVKGLNPEPPGTPESFKVLVRELQTLGLHVSLDKDSDE
ncbi:DNA-directed RNA polymerase subunit beta [Candidatus Poribacteria bacterium]|nr:MAG: DNA-directed RNA polymerase subunit beta [Candidatus Poribacteria bacterium]